MTAIKRHAPVQPFARRKRLREMADTHATRDALADPYPGDRPAVLRLLNEALATELVCVLRYRRHHFISAGLGAARIAQEFLVHADEELAHADLIADRIVQLGGEPDFAPDTLKERSHAKYIPATGLSEMVRENLVAERIGIDSYRGLIEYLGEADRPTRRMLESILGVKEAHADELLDLLQDAPADP